MSDKKANQGRHAITIQCKIGEDDDLIKWHKSFPSGTRQSNVKRVLRDALGYEQPGNSKVFSIDTVQRLVQDEINKALDEHAEDTRQFVMGLLEKHSFVGVGGERVVSIQDVEDELNDEETNKRLKNMRDSGGW